MFATTLSKDIISLAWDEVIPLFPPELTFGETTTLSPAAVTAVSPYESVIVNGPLEAGAVPSITAWIPAVPKPAPAPTPNAKGIAAKPPVAITAAAEAIPTTKAKLVFNVVFNWFILWFNASWADSAAVFFVFQDFQN